MKLIDWTWSGGFRCHHWCVRVRTICGFHELCVGENDNNILFSVSAGGIVLLIVHYAYNRCAFMCECLNQVKDFVFKVKYSHAFGCLLTVIKVALFVATISPNRLINRCHSNSSHRSSRSTRTIYFAISFHTGFSIDQQASFRCNFQSEVSVIWTYWCSSKIEKNSNISWGIYFKGYFHRCLDSYLVRLNIFFS